MVEDNESIDSRLLDIVSDVYRSLLESQECDGEIDVCINDLVWDYLEE